MQEEPRSARETGALARFLRRLKAYALERFLTIGFLWAGIGAVAVATPYVARLFAPQSCALSMQIKLAEFVDERLLVVLSLGLMVSISMLSLSARVFEHSRSEQDNLRVGQMRLWDEISSAATHIAFGTFIVALSTDRATLGWTVPGYIALAHLTYNFDSRGSLVVRNDERQENAHDEREAE